MCIMSLDYSYSLAVEKQCLIKSQLMDERSGGSDNFVDGLVHVDGDADRPCLIGDGAGDTLADPPGCIGGKFIASLVLEFIDRLH